MAKQARRQGKDRLKVLVVGGGGREHALAWKLAQSPRCGELLCAPGNPGTARLGRNVPIQAESVDELTAFATDQGVDLVVVGPEAPLCEGLVDKLTAAGVRAFGPTAAAARLEGDKAYSKQVMRQSAVPTGESRVFDEFQQAKSYIASRDEPVVVKASGLAAGKGVFVCDDPSDAINAAETIMVDRAFGEAGARIVVEEKLLGEEASILAFVDGRNIYVMESSQDHKRIGDGDTGPNTGGMGAYSPAPIVTPAVHLQIEREVLVPIVEGLRRDGAVYKGVLYAGLMLTAGGPRVLEFNCRFGDPETQPVLMRLQSDLLEVCESVIDGTLDRQTLAWDERPAVCVVMASGGYPAAYEKGKPISGLDEAEAVSDVTVFHAGTAERDGQVVTAGGRVLGVTALGTTIPDAQERAYEAVGKIRFEGAYWRKDIASKAVDRG